MRCLTFADALRERGAEINFICRELPGNMISIIENKGYSVARLRQSTTKYVAIPDEDVPHSAWLGTSWQKDADETIAALECKQPQWLVVDHYSIDKRWEVQLRNYVDKIMVIDDLADRTHDCDFLLDQNLYHEMETRYENLVPVKCRKLLGPRFALLRPEFATARKNIRRRDGLVRRILVFYGGVDSSNETLKALHALVQITDCQFVVDVVVGGSNPHSEHIQKFCLDHHGFNYYCQVDNIAELMAAADLAIGAGGTATWERCAVGVPAIVSVLADNQKELSRTGARCGLFFYLGDANSITSERLRGVVRAVLCLPETLQSYSENCCKTVDGKGCYRVVNTLMPTQISIRRAAPEDCDSVYEWRNAEETRRYIFNTDVITLDSHRDWYNRTLSNPSRILLIGERDHKPVGVLRYDISGSEALISVYLVPGTQGQGVGSQLIYCGSTWIRENYPQLRVVNAEIFRENIASLRAFESAGYKEHHLIFQEAL